MKVYVRTYKHNFKTGIWPHFSEFKNLLLKVTYET